MGTQWKWLSSRTLPVRCLPHHSGPLESCGQQKQSCTLTSYPIIRSVGDPCSPPIFPERGEGRKSRELSGPQHPRSQAGNSGAELGFHVASYSREEMRQVQSLRGVEMGLIHREARDWLGADLREGVAAGPGGHVGGSGAVSSLAVKLAWVPGPASVFTVGSQRHSSLGGDSTQVLTPSCLSGPPGGKGVGTGQLPAAVTVAVTPGEHDPPGLLTHL